LGSHPDNKPSITLSSSNAIVRVFKSDAAVPEPTRDMDDEDAAAAFVIPISP
jgi:hypothetical protein